VLRACHAWDESSNSFDVVVREVCRLARAYMTSHDAARFAVSIAKDE
jgi:hypothetical protein